MTLFTYFPSYTRPLKEQEKNCYSGIVVSEQIMKKKVTLSVFQLLPLLLAQNLGATT